MGIVWQGNVIDLQGNALPAANVEVRDQIGGGLVNIYSDFGTAAPLPNPFVTDAFGFARFFVQAPGLYRIQASKSGFVRVWEFVLLLDLPVGGSVPTGVVTPPALAVGNTNDWDAGLSGSSNIGRVRAAGDAGGSVLTGMLGGVDGRRVIMTNISVNAITIPNESALSLVINRFSMNGDLFWPAGASYEFIYDGALSRWSRLGN